MSSWNYRIMRWAQAFGAGITVLAVNAWLYGYAGPVHGAMAPIGLALVFADVILAPARWRQAFAPMPWGQSCVAAAIVGGVVFVGQYIGL
jgi:hypothetical protein